jgi:hypothetical protein
MCFTSASGCSEDCLMSLSFMLRIRPKSVLEVLEEDGRFTLCCLSKGDDVDAILRFGMDYGHRNALQQSQSHETLLVVPEAVVFKRESGTVEYPLGIHKIQSMVLQVPLALNLVPCEPPRLVYMPSVYTSRRPNCCRLDRMAFVQWEAVRLRGNVGCAVGAQSHRFGTVAQTY